MAKNPFGHPPDCGCKHCQDWKDAQLGMELLGMLKESKRQRKQKICPECNRKIGVDARFCPYCGQKQE